MIFLVENKTEFDYYRGSILERMPQIRQRHMIAINRRAEFLQYVLWYQFRSISPLLEYAMATKNIDFNIGESESGAALMARRREPLTIKIIEELDL